MFPNWSPPLRILTEILCAFLISPMHAEYPAHLILIDLITLLIFGEENL
jgi:hypothetical protein